MRELERRFPRELAVVGVHSGKYIAERETANIREAAHRLGVHHPVVNDRQFRVWRSYAVRAWPTLVAVDPTGYVVGMHAGEFTSEKLEPFVERLIGAFDPTGELDRRPLAHETPPSEPAARLALRWPGKVALDAGRRRLAIADTGRARVLVGTLSADGRRLRVERIVGGADAPPDARLVEPQGLAFDGDALLVADPGAHVVRAVALSSGMVRTAAGTGAQLRTRADMAAGALSSPWDVAVAEGAAYVAMAGIHRLWRIAPDGRAAPFSGSGREEILDAPHPEAALAQPMGIVAHDGALWFADAESSAVRRADLDPAGGVTTLVGTGLFDFGDADGVGDAVRLQHPQGLAAAEDGRLLIADSYNGALKWLDPETRRVTTWVRALADPTGVAIGDRVVYAAEPNAHRIAVVDRETGSVEALALE